MIDDVIQNETIRVVVDSKLIFCNDYNLLMYFKSIMIVFSNKQIFVQQRKSQLQIKVEKINFFDSDNSDSDNDDENDLSNIENSIQFFH